MGGFFFDRDPENAASLFRTLEEFWGGEIPGISKADELTVPGLILQFGVPPNRIDLINAVDGVGFREARSARITATLATGEGEVPVYYMSLEDLIRNKQVAGRPKDLDDLAYLTRARDRTRR